MRGVTWVVIEEVKSGDWGIGGQRADHRGRARARRRASPPDDDVVADTASPPRGRSLPAEAGFADVGGVRIAYEVFGQGEETLLLLPPWAIIHSRFWKLQVPYLARHFRVVTFDPRGNGRSDRPERRRRLRPAARRRATRSPCSTRPAPTHCVVVVHCAPRPGGAAARRRPRRARPRRVLHVARAADHAAAARAHRLLASTGARPSTRAGRRRTATTGRRTTAATSSSSSAAASRSRTRPSRSRTAIDWGLETTPETLAQTIGAPGLDRDDGSTTCSAASRCPLLVIAGRRGPAVPPDRGAAFADATGAELVELRGRRPLPAGAPAGAVQPDAARLLRARRTSGRRRAARWRRAVRAAEARAVRLVADRARPRLARRRDRARAARARSPELRDRLARPGPGHARARGAAASASIPAARCSPTSRATSPPSRASTSSTCSRRGGGWTRSCSPTSCSSTTSCASEPYDLWIGDEAWELDYYLHENPELKTRRLLLPHRLRRLAAAARGRRRRGAADRRLQRRDDRAHRPLPARARPRDLRRPPGGRRARTTFGDGPARRSGRGSRSTSTSPATCSRPTPARRRTARRCAELGYAPDERVCVVTVGGSGVGGGLLQRVIDALPGGARGACPSCA